MCYAPFYKFETCIGVFTAHHVNSTSCTICCVGLIVRRPHSCVWPKWIKRSFLFRFVLFCIFCFLFTHFLCFVFFLFETIWFYAEKKRKEKKTQQIFWNVPIFPSSVETFTCCICCVNLSPLLNIIINQQNHDDVKFCCMHFPKTWTGHLSFFYMSMCNLYMYL